MQYRTVYDLYRRGHHVQVGASSGQGPEEQSFHLLRGEHLGHSRGLPSLHLWKIHAGTVHATAAYTNILKGQKREMGFRSLHPIYDKKKESYKY
jgi:hypothetical protein